MSGTSSFSPSPPFSPVSGAHTNQKSSLQFKLHTSLDSEILQKSNSSNSTWITDKESNSRSPLIQPQRTHTSIESSASIMSGNNTGNSQTGASDPYYYSSSGQCSSVDRWLGESSFDGPWNPVSPRDYTSRHGADKSKDGAKGKGKGSRSGGKSGAKK